MRRVFFFLFSVIAISVMNVQGAFALSSDIVIRQVQAGSAVSAYDEFVEIENQGVGLVDVTNWKVQYVSASGGMTRTLAWFEPSEPSARVFLNSQGREMIGSHTFLQRIGLTSPGFKGIMNDQSGTIRIVNANQEVVDMVGWGATTGYEGVSMASVSREYTLLRVQPDSDNNQLDFVKQPQADAHFEYGGLVEYTDVCSNTDEMDFELPKGMDRQADGTCTPIVIDLCPNLAEVHEVMPDGYELIDGACMQIDVCSNIEDIQPAVPDGFSEENGVCTEVVVDEPAIEYPPVYITELLPNPSGTDTGNEYIELYNPSDEVADLTNYYITIGTHTVALPDVALEPKAYYLLTSDEADFTLVNTYNDGVELYSRDDVLQSSTQPYQQAKDDRSWVVYQGEWQFAAPSPSRATDEKDIVQQNDTEPERADDNEVVLAKEYAPCPAGKYRNPATNRCKTIEVTPILKPCSTGQYRNPSTGRCKNIVLASAMRAPCAEGQYRNPATNRCKNIATTASVTLKPCKDGYERNPETNRCRKVRDIATEETAKYPVVPYEELKASGAGVGWWLLGGLTIIGAGYGMFEWRHEVARSIRQFFGSSKGGN